MRIVTSSWFTTLPPDMQKIGISRGTPRGYPAGYRRMPELAPGAYFKSVTVEEYHQRFMAQLATLDPSEVVAKIEALAEGRDAALLCFEKPHAAAWCHRGFVSAWLRHSLGLDVPEFGLEDAGAGWSHPKIPAQYRLSGDTKWSP